MHESIINKQELINLITSLVRIPSVTESPCESDCAKFIYEWFGKIDYFKENKNNLILCKTPLEGRSDNDLCAVVARVNAAVPTKRTILFISHFDVVGVKVFDELEDIAFEPKELAPHIDYEGNFLYGRGCMDMKCGVALEMLLLKAFSQDTSLFNVNLIAAFVGDEENSSAGMRGVVPHLARLASDEGLKFLAAVNTEPCEPGRAGAKGPMIFLGSIGKYLPFFYITGIEAHIGNYYKGLSAALIASNIIALSEANPSLADIRTADTPYAPPSWSCLELKIIKDAYSVTVPNRAVVYFNCYSTSFTPADIINQMQFIAQNAIVKTQEYLFKSSCELKTKGYSGDIFAPFDIAIITYEDMCAAARENYKNFDSDIANFAASLSQIDMRDAGIKIVEKVLQMSKIPFPFIVTGFLPPYMPPVTSREHFSEAASKISCEAKRAFNIGIETAEFFEGLCDLSYMGGANGDILPLANNLPGFGQTYTLPTQALSSLNIPVMNLGPVGFDAHKKTERLELDYSTEKLPYLLEFAIRTIDELSL